MHELRKAGDRGDGELTTVLAVAVGGVLGASGRYAVDLGWPVHPHGFPWATFAVNVAGCLLIGVLMTVLPDPPPHRSGNPLYRLWRPFLGIGLLGGFTTFSTYAVQVVLTADGGHPAIALTYLAGTVAAAIAAVAAGAAGGRAMTSARHRE